MPDLEGRITDTLDRLGERPDPARILEQVGKRRRHLRVMHRVQTAVLIVVVLAGVGGGMYALGRAFGIGASQPVPNNTGPGPRPSVAPSVPPPSHLSSPPPSVSPTGAVALCSDLSARVSVASTEGA